MSHYPPPLIAPAATALQRGGGGLPKDEGKAEMSSRTSRRQLVLPGTTRGHVPGTCSLVLRAGVRERPVRLKPRGAGSTASCAPAQRRQRLAARRWRPKGTRPPEQSHQSTSTFSRINPPSHPCPTCLHTQLQTAGASFPIRTHTQFAPICRRIFSRNVAEPNRRPN